MKVIPSDWLEVNLDTFDLAIQKAVFEFAYYVETHGFKGLKGRNKSSALPNPTSKKEHKHTKFAQKYCLWHYHLGIPCYIKQTNGELTSEYILHYCYYDDVIVLVDIGTHPPFNFPSVEKLSYADFGLR